MKQRGRPRKIDSSPLVIAGSFGQRPNAPSGLTLRQADIWRETVASEPVDFFATAACRAILSDYCRHRESLERIAELIDGFEPERLAAPDGPLRYHALLKMRNLEATASALLATKMRLTNQSRYVSAAATTATRAVVQGRKPWE